MAELKPCPFCGCDMKIETATIDYIEDENLVFVRWARTVPTGGENGVLHERRELPAHKRHPAREELPVLPLDAR